MTLYTFGYQKKTGSERVAELVSQGQAVLADIRYNPTHGTLAWTQEWCSRAWGSSYVHLKDLGNVLYREGGMRLLDRQRGITTLCGMLEHSDVIIMCCCSSLSGCHREYVASLAEARIPGLRVVHIGDKGSGCGPVPQLTLTLF